MVTLFSNSSTLGPVVKNLFSCNTETTDLNCKHCKKHTKQVISIAKKKDRSSLKKGSLARLRKRGRADSGYGNSGKVSRGALSSWKRYNQKGSKKPDFRYKCSECKKMSVQKRAKRAKKLELK